MPVSVKVGGAWKTATAVFNKVGGVWKTATDMPVKVGGVWKTGILVQGAYESIASATGTGSSNTITFSSIPSTYQHLQLRYIGRSTAASGGIDLILRFNGSSTAAYTWHYLQGPSTLQASSSINDTAFYYSSALTGSVTSAGIFGVGVIDIADYTNTSKTTVSRALWGRDTNGSGTIQLMTSLWNNTAAVTSITLTTSSGNFETGTNFALYGIKG